MKLTFFLFAFFSLIVLLISLILLAFKNLRRRAKKVATISAATFLISFVVFLVTAFSERSENKSAQQEGFVDAADMKKAEALGITDPAIWREQKQLVEERGAKEERAKRDAEAAKEKSREEQSRLAQQAKAKEQQIQEDEKRKATARRDDLLRSPVEQDRFIQALDRARSAYRAGKTDLQRGAARPTRAKEICSALPSSDLRQWIGKITRLTTNSSGEGVLAVEIAKNVTLLTMPTSITDSAYGTMIPPSSSLYQKLLEMKGGDFVRFDARLFPSDTDCYAEISLTMRGSLEEPEFVANFIQVRRVDVPPQ